MASTLIQFRADLALRQQANDLCQKLGLDLSTYLRLCMARLIQEQGVPFPINIKNIPTANEAISAMEKLTEISKANGNSNMSLDEINDEINAARKN